MRDSFPTGGVPGYQGVRVTVTGASGLLGSHAVKLLKESGAFVRAVTHQRAPNEFTRLADEVLEGRDLMHPEVASEVVAGVDVVIGGAGVTGGIGLVAHDPVSYAGPATALAINTLHACHMRGVPRFGYLSSTTVYPASDHPIREEDLDLGIKPYHLYRGIGYSKRFIEQLCDYYSTTTKVKSAIVRPSGAYGRFDNFDQKTSHVIPGMIRRALESTGPFEIWGDGTDTRDLIHAQDVARLLLVATIASENVGPVNAASGNGITTYQMARAVLTACGQPDREVVVNPAKPTALKTRLVDVTRAQSHLNFKAEIGLAEGLADTVAWFRQ